MINANLKGLARTAFLTLRARADEHKRPDRLFDDPWSSEWYPHLPKYDDYEAWYDPAFQLMSAVRTRLIDDLTSDFLSDHAQATVIELGAGLSTRYYRTSRGAQRWIELDLPEVVVVRRKIDLEVAAHWFIGSSAASDNWLTELPADAPQRVLLIAEGLLMYLPAQEVAQIFQLLSEHFSGATFIFDVVSKDYADHMQAHYKRIHAPLRWGVHERELSTYGLNISATSYLANVFPERWERLPVGEHDYPQGGYLVVATIK